MAALEDDLNTPDALAEMNGLARRLGKAWQPRTGEIRALAGELLADGELIGLLHQDPEAWFKGEAGEDDAAIDALVRERDQARADRDFARADDLRDQLSELGIALEDGAGGTRWRREQLAPMSETHERSHSAEQQPSSTTSACSPNGWTATST